MRPTQLPPPDEPVELTDETAPDFLEAHRVALLAFLDAEDAASQRMRPRLELLAARLARPGLGVALGILDVRHDRLVAEALRVESVPTTVVFVEGEVVDRIQGAPPESILEETLRARLKTVL